MNTSTKLLPDKKNFRVLWGHHILSDELLNTIKLIKYDCVRTNKYIEPIDNQTIIVLGEISNEIDDMFIL